METLNIMLFGSLLNPERIRAQYLRKPISLYAVSNIGNGLEVLKLYVEEMNNPNSGDTKKRAYQRHNIEKASTVNGGVQSNSPSSLANTVNAIRTVSDLLSHVKNLDFSPNTESKVVNANITPDSFKLKEEPLTTATTEKPIGDIQRDSSGERVSQDGEEVLSLIHI